MNVESHESSYQDHLQASNAVRSLGFAVITLSDTRTEETDRSGQLICRSVVHAGHHVVDYQIVPDEVSLIRSAVQSVLSNDGVDVLVTNGGTGISLRDSAYEVLDAFLDKRLDGFGEIFRMLSFHQIGSSAMLSRAVGGTACGKIVFALPGSTAAVRLAMEQLILPQVAHLDHELHKESG